MPDSSDTGGPPERALPPSPQGAMPDPEPEAPTAPTQAIDAGARQMESGRSSRVAISTLIFTVATAVSRVAGLAREIIQAAIFGVSREYSAFTVASQIPNLVSNLFSQAALGAAFVPIFTDLLAQGKRREAYQLASDLFWMLLVVLGVITLVWMGIAGFVMPLFVGNGISAGLAAGLSRVLFPVVLLLSLTGLFVGILQAYDEFTMPAIAPAIWNVVIIVLLVVLHTHFEHSQQVYAYAIAWLAATIVQMVLVAIPLRRLDFQLTMRVNWRDPRVRQVLILFLPVTLSVGIINFDGFLNTELGTLIPGGHAPAEINDAFRLYMLPQGVFSVAVTTVLFPSLARMANARDPRGMRATLGSGMRQIVVLLVPCAGLMAVLADPIIRLVYEHGALHASGAHFVAVALFWYAISLPFAGINLLLTRTFFALQRPWIPSQLAVINLIVDLIVSIATYKPLGLAGLIIGTLAANVAMTWLQLRRLRIGFNGRLELDQTLMITVRVLLASAIATVIGWIIWEGCHAALGYGVIVELVELGLALGIAGLVYWRLVLAMRVPEAEQVSALIGRRFGPLLRRVRG